MWIVFLGVTVAVGQLLYRVTGQRGNEERLQREIGRAVHYLDVGCALWLIACGAYALWFGREVQLSFAIGLVIVALAGLRRLRSRRSRQSPLLTDSLTVVSDLLAVATQEACAHKQNRIELHHVLLAIVRMPARPAGLLLAARGATETKLRAALAPYLEPTPDFSNDYLFDDAVTRAVTRAMDRIEAHGDHLSKPEHLLRALLIEPESLVSRALIELGIDLQQLKDSLLAQIRKTRPVRDR